MKRNVRILILLSRSLSAYTSSKRASYERNSRSGSLPQIRQQITILHARLITREQYPGFSKAVFLEIGRSHLLSCGSTVNVRTFSSPLLSSPLLSSPLLSSPPLHTPLILPS